MNLRLWPDEMAVYLHRAPVDFRKQINGLVVLVSESMDLDPFKPALYVFVNGARNRVKVLYWDEQGFCLWLKRLEEERFRWPFHLEGPVIELDEAQLRWLLDGLDLKHLKPHRSLEYRTVL